MFNSKRFIAATFLGFATGFICLALASSSPGILPAAVGWQIVFSRALAGFTIGISNMRSVHWSLHGLIIGGLFSLPLAFSGLMAPDTGQYDMKMMFVFTIILGMIYGFLIELIVTKAFRETPKAV